MNESILQMRKKKEHEDRMAEILRLKVKCDLNKKLEDLKAASKKLEKCKSQLNKSEK